MENICDSSNRFNMDSSDCGDNDGGDDNSFCDNQNRYKDGNYDYYNSDISEGENDNSDTDDDISDNDNENSDDDKWWRWLGLLQRQPVIGERVGRQAGPRSCLW